MPTAITLAKAFETIYSSSISGADYLTLIHSSMDTVDTVRDAEGNYHYIHNFNDGSKLRKSFLNGNLTFKEVVPEDTIATLPVIATANKHGPSAPLIFNQEN